MTAVQLLLIAGIPTIAVVVSMIIEHRHFNRIDRQLDSIEHLIDSSEASSGRHASHRRRWPQTRPNSRHVPRIRDRQSRAD
jgi:hypothetical protein